MIEVNQQLIAERLTISRATVSRCFTNHPGISPVTRAKVFKIAAELGYTHLENRTARAKKKAPQVILGVLICADEKDYAGIDHEKGPGEQLLAGVTECAHLNSAKVEVHFVNPHDHSLKCDSYAKIRKIRQRWKGIILIHSFPESVISELSLLMPVVSLVEQAFQQNFDCIDSDHSKGISAAIDHLYSQGHRRIGFFAKQEAVESIAVNRRYAAFVEKMTRLALPFSHEDVINVFPSPDMETEKAVDHAAARTATGITAWVCATDAMAYELIHGLSRRGLQVAKDVSVTGFDGIATPEGFTELSTVVIPFREIGASGAQRLFERMKKRFGSPQHVFIDCQFKQGQSVAQIAV